MISVLYLKPFSEIISVKDVNIMDEKENAEVPEDDENGGGERELTCHVCGRQGALDACGTCSPECCEKHEQNFIVEGHTHGPVDLPDEDCPICRLPPEV
ncbi:MAG: hypothetical protein M1351_02160 [Candidatus Thermoplasmatota archaeon]|nr:hypothetical protein [Candidatus Thermoplasmatota archaeon]